VLFPGCENALPKLHVVILGADVPDMAGAIREEGRVKAVSRIAFTSAASKPMSDLSCKSSIYSCILRTGSPSA